MPESVYETIDGYGVRVPSLGSALRAVCMTRPCRLNSVRRERCSTLLMVAMYASALSGLRRDAACTGVIAPTAVNRGRCSRPKMAATPANVREWRAEAPCTEGGCDPCERVAKTAAPTIARPGPTDRPPADRPSRDYQCDILGRCCRTRQRASCDNRCFQVAWPAVPAASESVRPSP